MSSVRAGSLSFQSPVFARPLLGRTAGHDRAVRGVCGPPKRALRADRRRPRCRLYSWRAQQEESPSDRRDDAPESPETRSRTTDAPPTPSPSSTTSPQQQQPHWAPPPELIEELWKEDPEFAELDLYARAWIGDSFSRWHWWEAQKAHRRESLRRLREQQQLANETLDELRRSLQQLQSVTGISLVGDDGSITAWGWTLFVTAALTPVLFLVFISLTLSDALNDAWKQMGHFW
eukprot:ctg_653.g281